MTKYYLQQNCRERAPVQAGPYKVQFDPVSFHAGSWWGVYYTEDQAIQAELDRVVATKKAGVTEVDEQEFWVWAKKKGTQQTHTWKVTESVLDQRPSPQAGKSESSADSVNPANPVAVEEKDHELDELVETRVREEPSKTVFVSSQAALSEALGISIIKFRELAKLEGSPSKYLDEGYKVSEWETFLNAQK